MAGIAVGLEVFAGQRKVGEVMVEGALIELHDIGIPPFVIGVAFCAVGVLRTRIPTMEAMPGIDVHGNRLMAVEAELALLRTLESQVAVAAFGFVLRMTFDDVARHHQRFDLGGCVLCSKTHRHQRKSE